MSISKIVKLRIFNSEGSRLREIIFDKEYFIIGDLDKVELKETTNALGKSTLINMISYCLCGNALKELESLNGYKLEMMFLLDTTEHVLVREIGEKVINIDGVVHSLNDSKQLLGIDRVRLQHIIHYEDRANVILDDPNKFELFQSIYSLLGLDQLVTETEDYYSLFEKKKKLDKEKGKLKKKLDKQDNFALTQELKSLNDQLEKIQTLDKIDLEIQTKLMNEKHQSLVQNRNRLLQNLYDKRSRVEIITNYIQKAISPNEEVVEFIMQANEEIGSLIKREISDVIKFHKAQSQERIGLLMKEKNSIINDLEYIKGEIDEIDPQIPKIEEVIKQDTEIMQLFKMHNFITNRISELMSKNEIFNSLEKLDREIDELIKKKMITYIDLKNIDLDTVNSLFREYSNELVSRLYPASYTSYFDMKIIESNKVSKTGYPYTFNLSISKDNSEGVRNARNFIVDLLIFKFSKSVDFMIWDSGVFNGTDPLQVNELVKELKSISRETGKQFILCLNKFQAGDFYEELLFNDPALDDSNRLVLSNHNTLLNYDFSRK